MLKKLPYALALALTATAVSAQTKFFLVTPLAQRAKAPAIAVSLTPAYLPNGALATVYSFDFQPLANVTGDPNYDPTGIVWSPGAGIPSGLTLNQQGVLSGTPTAAVSNASFDVSATYKGLSATATYSMTVDTYPQQGAVAGYDFGAIGNGNTQVYGVALTNKGKGTLTLRPEEFSISGEGFSIESTTCTAVLAVSKACTVNVKFSASESKVYTGNLRIASGAGYLTSAITGYGTPLPMAKIIAPSGYTGFNVANAAGPLTEPKEITVEVPVGGKLGGYPALTTGVLPKGSVVRLVNSGAILGGGGIGGTGRGGGYVLPASNGGSAVVVTSGVAMTIDNTNGQIFGGGGGGGGGGNTPCGTPGSGGGGGAGYPAGTRGSGGYVSGVGTAPSGVAGTETSGGSGGAPMSGTSAPGGAGGPGGGVGLPGTVGYTAANCNGLGNAGTPGGLAGYAVDVQTGASVTWASGNNPTQVKGR